MDRRKGLRFREEERKRNSERSSSAQHSGFFSALSVRKKIAAYVSLTKPRIIELLIVCTIPTMIFAAHGWPGTNGWEGFRLIVVTIVSGALSAGGSHVFNSYFERDIDSKMERTARRPLVTGAVSLQGALIFAWVLCIFSAALFFVFTNALAAILDIVAVLIYVVLYTLILKRRTSQNIVWGGAAGCMPVLIAWAATANSLSWAALVLFMVIFLWTPAHYWPLSLRYSREYHNAGVPMLGAVKENGVVGKNVVRYAWATVLFSLLLVPVGGAGAVYCFTAVVAGAWFLWKAAGMRQTAFHGVEEAAMEVFHASIVYLALVFMSVALDPFLHLAMW